MRGTLSKIDCPPKYLGDYYPTLPEVVQQIRKLGRPLRGLRVAHVNATSLGGGVAEILRSLVPLQRDIGLDSNWYIIPPNEKFFEVTKQIHNFLQGKEGDLTDEQKKIYLDHNSEIAGLLAKLKVDFVIVHDPQPAASLIFLDGQRPPFSIWRCHIDTSQPNKAVWNFLLPYLKAYDHFVFTMPEYTNEDFSTNKVSIITPTIDPLSPKNKLHKKSWAKKYLTRFGINPQKPLITQVSRFDPWKDPWGVIDAYRIAKKEMPHLQLALVAQMASDDPEGVKIYEDVKKYAKKEEGIFLLTNLPSNDLAINAFQGGSDIILQKSTREGFGMTVTEAMWKGAVVIGGNVGGIKYQIKDGFNGFLVRSPKEAAEKINYIFKNPAVAEKISHAAHLSVKNKFLTPHKILNYLKLFALLLSKKQLPEVQLPQTPQFV